MKSGAWEGKRGRSAMKIMINKDLCNKFESGLGSMLIGLGR